MLPSSAFKRPKSSQGSPLAESDRGRVGERQTGGPHRRTQILPFTVLYTTIHALPAPSTEENREKRTRNTQKQQANVKVRVCERDDRLVLVP